jgi:hypothetical protein
LVSLLTLIPLLSSPAVYGTASHRGYGWFIEAVLHLTLLIDFTVGPFNKAIAGKHINERAEGIDIKQYRTP